MHKFWHEDFSDESQTIKNFKIWPSHWRHNPPGPKQGQKQITSQIIEIKSWNLTLVLILTRGMQWWNRSFKNFKNFTPLVTSQSPGSKKVSKANNFPNNWSKNLKFDTCTNFDTRNSVMKPNYQKFQNLTPLVTSKSPGTKKGSKGNNFTNNWNKKLKFGICTNFHTRNAVMKSKFQKFQNLTPLVTSQSPVSKKVSKANNFYK